VIEMIAPSDDLDRHPENQIATPSTFSRGNDGSRRRRIDEFNE
jgi:hypothetical protein